MALLSQPAITLLERIETSERWTELERLEVGASDPALAELLNERLAELRTWPPPTPSRRRHRTSRALDDRVRRQTQIRLTSRGALRVHRLREGRRRRARPPRREAPDPSLADRPEASPGWWAFEL